MTDLTTLLSFFLKDLYAGTLGTTAPITLIQAGAGAVGAPAYSFLLDPDTGIFNSAPNTIAFSTGGGLVATMGAHLTLGTGVALIGSGTAAAAGDIRLQAPSGNSGTIQWASGGKFSVPAQTTVGPVTNSGTASITTFTVGASDAIFLVSADVSVTTSSNHTFSIDCVYTDAANNARTMLMPMEQLLTGNLISGALITNTLGVGAYASVTMQIRAKASTTITLRTSAGGTFTGVVYTTSGSITQIG